MTLGHGEVTAHAATEGHVCVCGHAAVGVCDPYYQQRSWGYPWSGLLPKNMLMSEGCSEMALPLTIFLPGQQDRAGHGCRGCR